MPHCSHLSLFTLLETEKDLWPVEGFLSSCPLSRTPNRSSLTVERSWVSKPVGSDPRGTLSDLFQGGRPGRRSRTLTVYPTSTPTRVICLEPLEGNSSFLVLPDPTGTLTLLPTSHFPHRSGVVGAPVGSPHSDLTLRGVTWVRTGGDGQQEQCLGSKTVLFYPCPYGSVLPTPSSNREKRKMSSLFDPLEVVPVSPNPRPPQTLCRKYGGLGSGWEGCGIPWGQHRRQAYTPVRTVCGRLPTTGLDPGRVLQPRLSREGPHHKEEIP